VVRYAPMSGPYLKPIDWPEGAMSGLMRCSNPPRQRGCTNAGILEFFIRGLPRMLNHASQIHSTAHLN